MQSVEFLKKVSEKINFKRQRYDDSNIPTDLDDIIVLPYFGDLKHTHILSAFILNNFKKLKKSKYIILISYPGFDHLFPYVDEYWCPSDLSGISQLFNKSDYFENKSSFYLNLLRTLNENFRNVINSSFLKELYYNKFTNKYWETFNFETNFYLPMIPSFSVLPKEVIKSLNLNNNKIFLFPSQTINFWSNGKYNKVLVKKEFYYELVDYLLNNKIFPVIWSSSFSYDLNDKFSNHTDCLILNSDNLFEVLPCIRATGLCLDLFNSVSKLSNTSRTPSIIFEERNKYFLSKEYEIDDLINTNLPNKTIFNFSNIIIKGNKEYWQKDLFKIITTYCNDTFSYLEKDSLPNSSEVDQKMNISLIRKINNKKLGTKFIKIEKLT